MKASDISKNSKEYKEAAWFINRLIDLDTLSAVEIINICAAAKVLAENLDITTVETIHKLEQTW